MPGGTEPAPVEVPVITVAGSVETVVCCVVTSVQFERFVRPAMTSSYTSEELAITATVAFVARVTGSTVTGSGP